MVRKLPPEAFDYYVNLGSSRSYAEVARKYNCAKKSVTKKAVKERWQERVQEIEAKARESAEAKAADSLENLNTRHLRTLRFIEAKAIEALKSMPLRSAIDAVRALGIAIRQERELMGYEDSDEAQAARFERVKKKSMTTGLADWEQRFYVGARNAGEAEKTRDLLAWHREVYQAAHPGSTEDEYRSKDRTSELFYALKAQCVRQWGPQWFSPENRTA